MSNGGWIKLHRKIIDNWIWQDPEKLKAWIDILMMVNHEDKKTLVNGKLVTIKRGERMTSIVKLSERWGWSRVRVKRFLVLLEEDGMCTSNSTTLGTTLKVSHYADYQGFSEDNRTTVDTANDTADDTAHVTADDTADDTQTRINKNNKELSKNDKNFLSGASAQKKSAPPTQKDIEAYCREKGYKMDVLEFMEYYRMREWELTGGKKVTKSNFKAAVDYWNRKGKKLAGEGGDNVAYFEEYVPDIRPGTESPFEGSLVDELKRRRS